MNTTLGQFSLFTLVGAAGTFAHYIVLIGLVSQLQVHPVPASVAGAIVGAVVNYGLNYRFTFRSVRRHRDALPRFLLIAMAGLALNTALMWLLVGWFLLHYVGAQLVATVCVLAWNYLANRRWTFSEGAECEPSN